MVSKYLREVCKIGQGHDCCRYLVAGTKGLECAKLEPELQIGIDQRVEAGLFVARADNCEGKPIEVNLNDI